LIKNKQITEMGNITNCIDDAACEITKAISGLVASQGGVLNVGSTQRKIRDCIDRHVKASELERIARFIPTIDHAACFMALRDLTDNDSDCVDELGQLMAVLKIVSDSFRISDSETV
jgi:hypothetical protein